jgi:hypothetical protein
MKNRKELADAWDDIAKEAKENMSLARDEFQKRAVLVGGLTVIAGGFVTAFDGGATSQLMTGGFPLILMLFTAKQTFLKTHFYDAMSSWALDKRDEVLENTEVSDEGNQDLIKLKLPLIRNTNNPHSSKLGQILGQWRLWVLLLLH